MAAQLRKSEKAKAIRRGKSETEEEVHEKRAQKHACIFLSLLWRNVVIKTENSLLLSSFTRKSEEKNAVKKTIEKKSKKHLPCYCIHLLRRTRYTKGALLFPRPLCQTDRTPLLFAFHSEHTLNRTIAKPEQFRCLSRLEPQRQIVTF